MTSKLLFMMGFKTMLKAMVYIFVFVYLSLCIVQQLDNRYKDDPCNNPDFGGILVLKQLIFMQ